jgi:spore coat protein U-like protein
MKKISLALTIVAMILGLSLSAQADTKTASMTVKGTIPEVVTVSVETLDFGTQNVGKWNYATADITVNASKGLSYKIALDGGLYYDANFKARKMKHSGSKGYDSYHLYKDNTHDEEWGDSDCTPGNTYPPGTSVSGTGTGSDQTYTVYGKNFVSSALSTGTYSDTVTVTVHY